MNEKILLLFILNILNTDEGGKNAKKRKRS